MLARSCTLLATVAFGLAGSLLATSADAQIIVGRGGGGVSVGIPGVGSVRLGAPLRSRGVYVAPYGVAPYGYGYGYGGLNNNYSAPYYGRMTRYAARPVTSLPTAGELRAMDDSGLLNALLNSQTQLDYELERFDTAATWQNYLRLPEDALPPASDDGRVMLGTASIAEALKRFDLTVANPRYVQISGLPSFAAMHAALGELASRMGAAPSMASADSAAELPSEQATNRVVPPAVPTPPRPSSIVAAPRDGYQPQSIEMRNLHAASTADDDAASGAAGDRDQIDAQPASTQPASTGGDAEQLPAPPPSLIAPQNEPADERSILSR